jgi:hypothetical protein
MLFALFMIGGIMGTLGTMVSGRKGKLLVIIGLAIAVASIIVFFAIFNPSPANNTGNVLWDPVSMNPSI